MDKRKHGQAYLLWVLFMYNVVSLVIPLCHFLFWYRLGYVFTFFSYLFSFFSCTAKPTSFACLKVSSQQHRRSPNRLGCLRKDKCKWVTSDSSLPVFDSEPPSPKACFSNRPSEKFEGEGRRPLRDAKRMNGSDSVWWWVHRVRSV